MALQWTYGRETDNINEMGTVRELAEQMWHGELDIVHEHHPVRGLNMDAEEIDDGLLYLKSIASLNTLDTGDGLVMLDAGHLLDAVKIHTAVRKWRPNARLAAAVFSHHHVDHVFGTAAFERESEGRGWPAPVVYGHENMAAHFDRYLEMRGWNEAINRRQFAIDVPNFSWPDHYRYPDVTYHDHHTFWQGNNTFEMHHARGETDDATWTYVPERKILHPGDLFIYATPNAGNPQKVQRYVSDWATALREMAGLGAELMLCGHGLPIFGAERIATALTDTAALLETIERQTMTLMNEGKSLDHVIHTVEIPQYLLDKPYLRPVYDHPQFIVRMVWRRYGGWYDGEPDNLLPAPRVQQATEWVTLAGGVEAVLARAEMLRAAGDLRLACHLVEFAALAEPRSTVVHELRAAVYGERSQQQESSMARNILNHAALASRQGKRDLAGDY